MRILYLHQYYKTPDRGGPIRSYYLSSALAQAGHDVELITSHNEKNYKVELINGVRIHFLPITYKQEYGTIRRGLAFLTFMWQAYKLALVLGKFDLCFATSTPLTVGWVALRLKRKKGVPFYFEVRDLWPEAPIQIGVIKQGWLKNILYRFEKKIYQQAELIIALSPGIRDYVEKIVPCEKIRIITNMSDCDFFKPTPKSPVLEKKFNVTDHFVITYFGAIGIANEIENIVRLATICKKERLHQVHFQIIGKGPRKQEVKRLIKLNNLDNVSIHGYMNKEGVREALNVTDAVFTSFKKFPVLNSSSPNKFFDGLAAGKIQLVTVDGWLRSLVETKRCGFHVDPENPTAFIEKIVPFLQQKTRVLEFQKNARQLAELYFSRVKQEHKFISLFDKEARGMEPMETSVYTLTA